MIYRQLSSTGDYTFGMNGGNFFVNTPAAIAQAIQTRLRLAQGEWFLNVNEGVPFAAQILGAGKIMSYNAAIQQTILSTSGVLEITAYQSNVDPSTRKASISCTVKTIYGQATVNHTFGN